MMLSSPHSFISKIRAFSGVRRASNVHDQRRPRVLALSSGGGHWVQLLRMRSAFADCDLIFATVDPSSRGQVAGHEFRTYPDANKSTKTALFKTAWAIGKLVWETRPDMILSTGAAGGFFAVLFGRFVGARGVFIDSMANAETLSVSAKLVLKAGGTVYTQWPELAEHTGAEYHGAVI